MLIVVESLRLLPCIFLLIQRITFNHIALSAILYSVFKVQSCAFQHFLCVEMSRLVGLSGLEPPTSRLSGECSNRLSYKPILVIIGSSITFATGGDKRDRTVDPLLAKQVLSQLSYTPIFSREHKALFRSSYPPRTLFQGPSKLNNTFFKLSS